MQINKANAIDLYQSHLGSSISQEMSGRYYRRLTIMLECQETPQRDS
jgi:hypothetical protein